MLRHFWSRFTRPNNKISAARPRRERNDSPKLILEELETRSLLSSSLHLDFGPSDVPAPMGYQAVSTASYDPSLGYGWQAPGGLDTRNRSTAAPLTTDFVMVPDNTFLANLADGTYQVRVTMGDADYAMPAASIWANGQQVASNVTTQVGQFATPAFTVQVTNGQLALRFASNTGGYFDLDALDVTPATPSSPPGGIIGLPDVSTRMILQDFNGILVPVNGDGDNYPNEYP